MFITPRTWLAACVRACVRVCAHVRVCVRVCLRARNFAKTRFRRFPMFRFSTLNEKSANISDCTFRFRQFRRVFEQPRPNDAERTSKSASSSKFALDRLIHRSVRPKNLGFGEILVSPIFHPSCRCPFSLRYQIHSLMCHDEVHNQPNLHYLKYAKLRRSWACMSDRGI